MVSPPAVSMSETPPEKLLTGQLRCRCAIQAVQQAFPAAKVKPFFTLHGAYRLNSSSY